MKNLNQYITEKLKVSKKQYNYYPKTREELKDLLKQLLEERGWEANLNDIDTSNITIMSGLFSFTEFNGDISNWDVSNVKDMDSMFYCCKKFEGKGLENWDVSNVIDMYMMFEGCKKFEGKCLENWDVSNVKDMDSMFCSCEKLDCDLSNWNVSNVTNMCEMFKDCKILNYNLSNWDVYNVKNYYNIFNNCPIEEKYKPKFG